MNRLTILTVDRSEASGLNVDEWAMVAEQTLLGEGVNDGELGLTFVSVAEMELLNQQHMGGSGPTDVLAFPLDLVDGSNNTGPGDVVGESGVPLALGDIVVCPDVAERQSGEHAGSFPAEMTLLVIHGVLHVLGHDHYRDDERLVMQQREKVHMARHGFGHPEFAT